MDSAAELEEWLGEARGRSRVAGVAAAVIVGDRTTTAANGITDVRTGRSVSTETVFRMGSLAKVLTATLVMAQVEGGQVALDDRLTDRVRGFVTGHRDPPLSPTIRHVLAKADGLQDHIQGFGTDDDAVERYVESLAEIGAIHAPGEMYSYGNSGTVVLARLLELSYGQSFDDLLQSRLLAPLGMDATAPLTNEADLLDALTGLTAGGQTGVAVAHTFSADGTFHAGAADWPPPVAEPRALASCGATLGTTIDDLARFARLHAAGEGSILGDNARRAMRHVESSLPQLRRGAGLGWLLDLDFPESVWHAGGSRPVGTSSFLWIHESGLAVAVLANGPNCYGLAYELVAVATRKVLGLDRPSVRLPAESVGPEVGRACAGSYQRDYARFTFEAAGRDLILNVEPGPRGDIDGARHASGLYEPINRSAFRGPGGVFAFLHSGDERRFAHDGRAARRL